MSETPIINSKHKNMILFLFQEDQDWGIVAMVLDRLFLWVFGVAAILGSMMILTESPSLFETTEPIDVKISKIASEEARVLASLA